MKSILNDESPYALRCFEYHRARCALVTILVYLHCQISIHFTPLYFTLIRHVIHLLVFFVVLQSIGSHFASHGMCFTAYTSVCFGLLQFN